MSPSRPSVRPVSRPSKLADITVPLVDLPVVLTPCRPPPQPSIVPRLPPRPTKGQAREDLGVPGWTKWRGIIPAAYPRTFPGALGELNRESQPFGSELEGESKEQRNERCLEILKGILKRRLDAEDALLEARAKAPQDSPSDGTNGASEEAQEPLFVAAESWWRDGASGDGLTLVCAHALGMHKEVNRQFPWSGSWLCDVIKSGHIS